jgi:cell division protease FtsH
MVDELAYALGGRTAEEVVFGDPSTGASNDIEEATALARRMVMEFGMSDRLGPMKYGHSSGEVFLGRDYSRQADYSNEVAAWIDEEVRALISAAHDEAREIISAHLDSLHRLADELIVRETLDRDEVAEIFHDVPKWEHAAGGDLRIRRPEGVAPSNGGIAAAQQTEPSRPH